MKQAKSNTRAGIVAALDARDPDTAQARLDAAPGLGARQRTMLQAMILALRGAEDEAVALLEGSTRGAGPVAMARLRLAAGRPDAALQELDRGEAETAASAQVRIAANVARGDAFATVAAVNAARTAFPDDVPLLLAVTALCQVGALDEAAAQLAPDGAGKAADKATRNAFIRGMLLGGRSDLLHRTLPLLTETPERGWSHLLNADCLAADDAGDRARIAATLDGLAQAEGRAHLAFRLANRLHQLGDEAGGDRLTARFKAMAAAQPDAVDPVGAGELLQGVSFDAIADWLAIPGSERAEWLAEAERVAPEAVLHGYAMIADPERLALFRSAMTPSDLAPLRALAEEGKPALVAHTHAGMMMGTILYYHAAGVPAWVMGAAPLSRMLIPGGESLQPLAAREPEARTLRKLLRELDAGRIVGLTADGQRGALSAPIRHHGLEARLPETLPRLVHRRQVPAFWMAAQWRDGKIVCDCRPAPAPEPGETVEAYSDRWFVFVLDQIRDMCRADPRNIPFGRGILRTLRAG